MEKVDGIPCLMLEPKSALSKLTIKLVQDLLFLVPFSGYDCYSFAADLQNRLKIVPMVPKTVKATSGLRSKESKTGGITLRKRLKYGSDRSLIADKGCLSQGILGNQVSKHLSDNTPT